MGFKKLLGKVTNKCCKGNQKKLFMNLIIFLLFGILLILIGNITNEFNTTNKNEKKETIKASVNVEALASEETYEGKIQRELTEILGKIKGVGRVSVMVSFEGGSETVPGVNTNNSDKKTKETDTTGGERDINEKSTNESVVFSNDSGSSKPLVIKKLNPKVSGVMVVAEGAENLDIRERLQYAVKTVLNIPAHKVSVMPMKK